MLSQKIFFQKKKTIPKDLTILNPWIEEFILPLERFVEIITSFLILCKRWFISNLRLSNLIFFWHNHTIQIMLVIAKIMKSFSWELHFLLMMESEMIGHERFKFISIRAVNWWGLNNLGPNSYVKGA